MADDVIWARSNEIVRSEDGDLVQEEPVQRLEAPDAHERGCECYEGGDTECGVEGKDFGDIGGVGTVRCVCCHGRCLQNVGVSGLEGDDELAQEHAADDHLGADRLIIAATKKAGRRVHGSYLGKPSDVPHELVEKLASSDSVLRR